LYLLVLGRIDGGGVVRGEEAGVDLDGSLALENIDRPEGC
jgi:hypothetical protein